MLSKSNSHLVLISTTLLVGCASTPTKMSDVQLGMSKAEVMHVHGKPQSTSMQANLEYMTYSYCVARCSQPPVVRVYEPFYVRLVDGKVESYGRTGDFDSTKTPTAKIQVEQNSKIERDVRQQPSQDMYTQLVKLKNLKDQGIITQEEFDARKKAILAQE